MFKLNDIRFIKGNGGSGREAEGNEHVSALLFFNNNRPVTFPDNVTGGGIHEIFSPDGAVALGIDDSLSDEERAWSEIVVDDIGNSGDTLEIFVNEWRGQVSLGVFTQTDEANVNDLATNLAEFINSGTNTHGYTAETDGSSVYITARAGMGEYLNNMELLNFDVVGSLAVFINNDFQDGVASRRAVYYYHVQQYFRMKPDGKLNLAIFDVPDPYDWTEIRKTMVKSLGTTVQIGVWSEENFALSTLTAIQSKVTAIESEYYMVSSVIYTGNIFDGLTLTQLAGSEYNLATLTARNVSADISQDMNGRGYDLFKSTKKTIGSTGAMLGCVSNTLSEDIGNPIDKFNLSDGNEYEIVGFGEGTTWESAIQSGPTLVDNLNNNRYLFLSKILGFTGSFVSDDHTAISYTSDYAWIHDNKIINRVIKDARIVLTPFLKAKLRLQTNGKLTKAQILTIQETVGGVIKPLVASTDLAGDPNNFDVTQWVVVDTNQMPNVAGKLTVGIKLVENGIAHRVDVPIGYVQSL